MKILAKNRQAYRDYQIIDKYEAGIVLTGSEVKSVKTSQISLKEGYIMLTKDNQALLIGTHISPYQKGIAFNPTRERKLLLNKKELVKLATKVNESNLTIVPLKIYAKRGRVKIEIGLAKRKSRQDKRSKLIEKDQIREIKRELK